jgi:hypothetical protein
MDYLSGEGATASWCPSFPYLKDIVIPWKIAEVRL